jgi:biopolymer transport protein ExbD/biopolymer transport protein TolR
MLRLRHKCPKLFSAIDPTRLAVVMLSPILVLLVVFMMYPNCGSCGTSVDLALATHSRLMPSARKEDAITIAITRNGNAYFGSYQVMPEQLVTPIRLAVSRGAERSVYLKVDARARYGDVSMVLDKVSAAYVEQVAFLTQPRAIVR